MVEGFGSGSHRVSTLCDSSKAFNYASQYFGIKGLPPKLRKNYLQNRIQSVSFNNKLFNRTLFIYDVQEAPILRPLLFVICDNELS